MFGYYYGIDLTYIVLVLPAILLQMDRGIQRFRHPCLKPKMAGVNAFIVRHRKGFVILFLALFIPAVYANNHVEMYYKLDESLPQDMPSILSNNKLKDDFGMASTHFIVLRDDLDRGSMVELEEAIEALPGITSMVAYDKLLPSGIPDFFIPQDILDTYGPVSEECARAMAEGVRRITGADLGVSVTGAAGPDPDERGVPVGIVYIGLAAPEGTFCRRLDLGRRRRDRIQGLAANHAFDVVRRYLQGLPVEQI